MFVSESALELIERGSTASGRECGLVAENAKEFIRVTYCVTMREYRAWHRAD